MIIKMNEKDLLFGKIYWKRFCFKNNLFSKLKVACALLQKNDKIACDLLQDELKLPIICYKK
jgi:hypothetical protein